MEWDGYPVPTGGEHPHLSQRGSVGKKKQQSNEPTADTSSTLIALSLRPELFWINSQQRLPASANIFRFSSSISAILVPAPWMVAVLPRVGLISLLN